MESWEEQEKTRNSALSQIETLANETAKNLSKIYEYTSKNGYPWSPGIIKDLFEHKLEQACAKQIW